MRKYVIGATAAAGLVGGSIAVAAVSPLGSALARPTTVQVGQAPSDPTTPGTSVPGTSRKADRGAHIDEALQGLVDDGTITTEQRDAVRQALLDHMRSFGPGRQGGGSGLPGMGRGMFKDGLDTVAKSLGMSTEDLLAQLKDGTSIADVARSKGIDPATVVNDLVAAATAKIDEAVAAGKLPADKADKLKARLPEMMQRLVDHQGRSGGWGRGAKGPKQAQPGQAPGADEQPSGAPSTTAAPTTTAPPTSTTAAPPTTPGTAGTWGGGPTTTAG